MINVEKSALTLSIVIGTFNRVELLQKCLNALIGKIKSPHEIIVIDAGSTDGTLKYLNSLPRVQVIRDDKLIGQAQSLNRVFKTLQSKYTCWLSDDNIVMDGILDSAVEILEQNLDIGMIALKVKDITGPHIKVPYIGGIWPTGVLNCNQGMLRTDLLQRVGGFSEEFRDYGIDPDLTTKVLLSGYKVAYSRHVAIHHYRDHETVSWLDQESRKQRLKMARALYQRKYATLLELDYRKNKVFRFGCYILDMGKIMHNLLKLIGVYRWLGYHARDVYNVKSGQFISNWDLFINRDKAYYLVQQMPEKLRIEFHKRTEKRIGVAKNI